MSGQRFGALDLITGQDTFLMEGLAGWDRVVNVRFVNRNPASVLIRLALVDAPEATALADLSVEDYLEFDALINAQDSMENSAIVVPPGYSLVARSNDNFVSVVAYGFEEEF